MCERCCTQRQVACYRTAISRSEQHYNGWFGLGEVYERQEKFALAEIHFRYNTYYTLINDELSVVFTSIQYTLRLAYSMCL
jgi:hypothetical protein